MWSILPFPLQWSVSLHSGVLCLIFLRSSVSASLQQRTDITTSDVRVLHEPDKKKRWIIKKKIFFSWKNLLKNIFVSEDLGVLSSSKINSTFCFFTSANCFFFVGGERCSHEFRKKWWKEIKLGQWGHLAASAEHKARGWKLLIERWRAGEFPGLCGKRLNMDLQLWACVLTPLSQEHSSLEKIQISVVTNRCPGTGDPQGKVSSKCAFFSPWWL